jgi:hypothetical protein
LLTRKFGPSFVFGVLGSCPSGERQLLPAQRERTLMGRPSIFVDSRGTVRRTICVGPWAVKIARNATGRRCNRFEADLWAMTTARRREMLCPVLARLPFGLALVMPRAQPLSEWQKDQLIDADAFPDWDYVPPDDDCPLEYKASDWGRLPDGRLVALDYSATALDDDEDDGT